MFKSCGRLGNTFFLYYSFTFVLPMLLLSALHDFLSQSTSFSAMLVLFIQLQLFFLMLQIAGEESEGRVDSSSEDDRASRASSAQRSRGGGGDERAQSPGLRSVASTSSLGSTSAAAGGTSSRAQRKRSKKEHRDVSDVLANLLEESRQEVKSARENVRIYSLLVMFYMLNLNNL